jgi:hypothetical protein
MDGSVKVLTNFSGNLNQPEQMQIMVNATLENVTALHRQNGTGIQNLFAFVDYGIVALKLRQIRFEVQDSPVAMSVIVYNHAGVPIVKGKVSSPHFLPLGFLTGVENLAAQWVPASWTEGMRKVGQRLQRFFPNGEAVKNLSAEFSCEKNRCRFPRLEMEVYDGWVNHKGVIDFSSIPVSYDFDSEWNHLNLARLSALWWPDQRVLEGNLFSKFSLAGKGLGDRFESASLQGGGTLSITDGDWLTLPMLGVLAKTDELKGLAEFLPSSGSSPFSDIHASFLARNEKIRTDDFVLLSENFSIKGSGEMTFEGVLNARGEVYLPAEPSEKVLKALFPGFQVAVSDQRLGPIPILLSGYFDRPEIQIDPALWPAFTERLLAEDPREALTNFLPEDFFFEVPGNS